LGETIVYNPGMDLVLVGTLFLPMRNGEIGSRLKQVKLILRAGEVDGTRVIP